MADITTEGGGRYHSPTADSMYATISRKLRAGVIAAAYKIRKNRFKDLTVDDKWPKEAHHIDGSRSWIGMQHSDTIIKLMEEVGELYTERFRTKSTPASALLEYGDVCALSMMLADNVGALPEQLLPPKIVCLCGSTRFKAFFEQANKAETLKGNIVLSVGCFPWADNGNAPEDVLGEDAKKLLDDLHKRKIDISDEILVLNVGGYIGSSTESEIAYAKSIGVCVRYFQEPKG